MVKDFKYIIKRIIIGVGIALILTFLKTNVFAQTISSYSFGSQVETLNSYTNGFSYYSSGNPWSNAGDGYVTFNFTLYKVDGTSTSANEFLRTVYVWSGNASYACNVGTASVTNSTFNNGFYSATCPVYLDSSGLTQITFGFDGQGNLYPSNYTFKWNGLMTFDKKSTSIDYNSILGTINANANANAQYNQQTMERVGQSIINNQNSNNQAIIDSQEETTNAVNDLNDTINDDDVSDSETQASSFFGNFQNNDHGLSGIITAPLSFIQSLSSSTCSPLTWHFGWFENEFSLPCATTIVQNNWPDFLTLYQTITFGVVAYIVILNIFALVKGFKDPDSDKLEVLEL